MSLLNQRHLFLSTLLYHQSQLFSIHPLKDHALIANELRILLSSQVASYDRVILANCVLLWPQWSKENLYAIDVSNCPGLATLIESPVRLPPNLAGELGFVIAILGYYNAQVSKHLTQLFLTWLDTSIHVNLQFKSTVLAMILAPHPPLPPPLLPSINTDPLLLITKLKDGVVEVGLKLMLVKLSLPLLSFFLKHHLEQTIPTVLMLLEKDSNKPLLWSLLSRISSQQPQALLPMLTKWLSTSPPPSTYSTTASPSSSSSSSSPSLNALNISLSPNTNSDTKDKKKLLLSNSGKGTAPNKLESSLNWIEVQFSGTPFSPSSVTPPLTPTPTTYHLLQWLLLILSPKASAAAAAAVPIPSSLSSMNSAFQQSIRHFPIPFHPPPDQKTLANLSRWVLDHLGPLFSNLIQKHKPSHTLIREIMEAMPEKHLDWWISLHCEFAPPLATTKMVCEWSDILYNLILHTIPSDPKTLLSSTALHFLVSNASSPLWHLRTKFPNSDTVLDHLDKLVSLCFEKATQAHAMLSCSYIFEHLRQVLFLNPTDQVPPIHSPQIYAKRLLKLIPYGEHHADEMCVEFLRFLKDRSLLKENDFTSKFLFHWLLEFQCTQGTASCLVDFVCISHTSIYFRKTVLEVLERSAHVLSSDHLTLLTRSILDAFTPDILKINLAHLFDKVMDQTSLTLDAVVVDAVMIHLTYPDTVASHFLSVAAKLPSPFTQSPTLNAFQRQVLQSPHTGLFRQSHFTFLMQKKEPSLSQLRLLFHQTSQFPLPALLWKSHEALLFYAAFELARYCLLTRLKTPFGSSSQTLAGIEQLLHKTKRVLFCMTITFLEKWVHAAFFQYTPNSQSSSISSTTTMSATTSASTNSSSSSSSSASPSPSFALPFTSIPTHSCLTWASVPKSSCVYFTANKQGILHWFQKMHKHLAKYQRKHAMVGEILWNEPHHLGSLVWLGWEECIVHPGYRVLAQNCPEAARELLPNEEQILSYLLLSDYDSLEQCLRRRPAPPVHRLDQFCWNLLQSNESVDPIEPIFCSSPLAYIRSALLENRSTRVLSSVTSAIPRVWIPLSFLDRFQLDLKDPNMPVKLLRQQRKLKNFALARALLRVFPDLSKIERMKLNLAEGQVVGFDVLHHFPKLLAKQLMIQSSTSHLLLNASNRTPVSPNITIFNTYLEKVPDTLVEPWFPSRHHVPPICAALFYAIHEDPRDIKAWRLLALYFADMLHLEETASMSGKALHAMIRYLELESQVHPKSHSMALHVLELVPKVHPKSLVSARGTAPDIWVMWVPQLVTLFRSSQPDVAQWASDVLERVAQTHPSACIYPILVACQDEHPPLLNAFQSVSLVASTRVFIQHALRLTVLWEEIWFHELLHLQSQFYKKLCTVEHILSHVHFLTKTCLSFPTTSHERWFQQFFEMDVMEALKAVEETISSTTQLYPYPSSEMMRMRHIWQPFRGLIHKLSTLVNKSRTLGLADLDFFFDLDLSDVYLPGTSEKLHSVHSDVLVLPTKTKPKKIIFTSQSGQTHAYLVKGREDLHLDQLMMQFIQMINEVLPKKKLKKAHVYSVIPLGTTAGIIQWIDAVSIYTLYKRHHHQLYYQPPPKPAQAFNTHAHRLLHVKQTNAFASQALRDPCSLEQLVTIYRSLCAESTDQLIKQELLFQSITSFEYLTKTREFTQSMALTSALGFFMGLGDRHLDNILFVAQDPQLVHIDYAICFDRGADPRILKIPEKVPFRLTRNFLAAMDAFYPICFQNTMQTAVQCIQDYAKDVQRLMESFFLYQSVTSYSFSSTSTPEPPSSLPFIELQEQLGQDVEEVVEAEESVDRLSGGQKKNKDGTTLGLPSTQILKELKKKLECNLDSSSLSLDQFVKHLIDQATDESNLASMYEGWLPWL